MRFLAALQFLTIIPLPRKIEVKPEELGRSAGYFPVIGLIIGLILAGLNWVFSLVLPPVVVNALLVVSLVILSGALHLDGFIDTCDGIAGHRTAPERWQVMQDSRVGAFGIVGALCLLLVRYTSLISIPESLLTATLILMPLTGRWAMVYAIFAYPYAKPSGLGKGFKQGVSWRQFTQATIITWGVAVVLFRAAGLVIMLGTWIIATATATCLKRKFTGLTGDTYGAINEVAEVGMFVLTSLLAYNHWLILT